MKIVVLDGAALNPGDLSWDWLGKFGAYTVYSGTDSETEAAARIGDAEIVLTNKTHHPQSSGAMHRHSIHRGTGNGLQLD